LCPKEEKETDGGDTIQKIEIELEIEIDGEGSCNILSYLLEDY
jgi:hypothetical protein